MSEVATSPKRILPLIEHSMRAALKQTVKVKLKVSAPLPCSQMLRTTRHQVRAPPRGDLGPERGRPRRFPVGGGFSAFIFVVLQQERT